jgi:hypothetical protein
VSALQNMIPPQSKSKSRFPLYAVVLSGPTAIRLLEKSILNLGVHSMQPLLRPLAFFIDVSVLRHLTDATDDRT